LLLSINYYYQIIINHIISGLSSAEFTQKLNKYLTERKESKTIEICKEHSNFVNNVLDSDENHVLHIACSNGEQIIIIL
jgi:hypothetical protein